MPTQAWSLLSPWAVVANKKNVGSKEAYVYKSYLTID